MLEIDWKSGYGYGDFVTGLGYAHNASIRYEMNVNLTFHWTHDINHKETPLDPETIVERMYCVLDILEPLSSVTINHKMNSELGCRFINNLEEFNPLHGLWHTNLRMEYTNNVVLWTSKHNTTYPGVSKDPALEDWSAIVKWIEDKGYVVKEVTYRTPVAEVIELIRTCSFGIGYDGLVHQLFKFFWKPLIVVCHREELNNLLIPQASIVKSSNDLFDIGLDRCIEDSKARCDKFKIMHREWLCNKENPYNHPLYNQRVGQ